METAFFENNETEAIYDSDSYFGKQHIGLALTLDRGRHGLGWKKI